MKYAIVYSSRTGNTRLLAETIRAALPEGDCLYFGPPDPAALDAERLYAGFWTNQGTCDGDSARFLREVDGREVFLFGTAGFGGMPAYFDKILQRTAENLRGSVTLVGSFMCQGKMPPSVRQRYEKMLDSGTAPQSNIRGMIDNFDRALSHPDSDDLEALRRAVGKLS